MKINSSTITLDEKDLVDVTTAVKKIAEKNNVTNVKKAYVDLSSNEGVVRFEIEE
jgi:hypothetical protein